jgi:hypothetical protein
MPLDVPSVRAMAERQNGQTSTIVEPALNSTGAAHDGQLAWSTLKRHLRPFWILDCGFWIGALIRPAQSWSQ